LYRELKLQKFKGSYEMVKEFIKPYRKKKVKTCMRFETEPGEQSQVDWGSEYVWIGDIPEEDLQGGIYMRSLKMGMRKRLNGLEVPQSLFYMITPRPLYQSV